MEEQRGAGRGAMPFPSPDDGHVDEEILEEVFTVFDGEVPEGLLRACDLFRTGVPARLDDVEAAVGEGRPEQAARLAHSLRGSTGAFGARYLSELAGQLEQSCGDGDAAVAVALVAEMRAGLTVFQAILDARLAAVTG